MTQLEQDVMLALRRYLPDIAGELHTKNQIELLKLRLACGQKPTEQDLKFLADQLDMIC